MQPCVVLQSVAAADHQQRKLLSRPSPLSRISQAVAGCYLPSIRRQKNIGPLVSALMLMSDVSSSPPTFPIQAERKRHCLLHRLRPLILHVLEVVHIVMVPCWKATDSRDGRLVSKTMSSHSF